MKETNHKEMELMDWLQHANPGDRYIYYVGNLAIDLGDSQKRKLVPTYCYSLYMAVECGQASVTLAQRRVGTVFEYLAIKLKGKG